MKQALKLLPWRYGWSMPLPADRSAIVEIRGTVWEGSVFYSCFWGRTFHPKNGIYPAGMAGSP